MNVPVGADGTLGIVDGISAPGLCGRPAGRAWTCSCSISNCPQINNPCNGFDPTPSGPSTRGARARDRHDLREAPGATSGGPPEVVDGGPFTTVQDLPGRVG